MTTQTAVGINKPSLSPLAQHNLSTINDIPTRYNPEDFLIPVPRLVFAMISITAIFFSFVANLFVLWSFIYDKKIRNKFSSLVVNLAITDLLINVFPMLLYTLYLMYDYWPFGRLLCVVWLSFAHITVFVSNWTLGAIAIDRYWSIKWFINYRKIRGAKKSVIILTVIWFVNVCLVLYPVLSQWMQSTNEYECLFDPAKNKSFGLALAIIGHHIPCVVIFAFTTLALHEIRKLAKIRPDVPTSNEGGNSKNNPAMASDQINAISRSSSTTNDEISYYLYINAMMAETTKNNARTHRNGNFQRKLREKKTYLVMIYIVVCYAMTSLPFHLIYDARLLAVPDATVEQAFKYLLWSTFLNSVVNPFLYSFSSPALRDSFLKLICRYKNT